MKTVKAYVASSQRERLEAELRANVKPRAGEHTAASSWPSELSERIAVEIRAYVLERNVGLTASVAAQVATGFFSTERDQLRARERELEQLLGAALIRLKELGDTSFKMPKGAQ